MMKKLAGWLLALCLLMSSALAQSGVQVVDPGGSVVTEDGVTLQKILRGTPRENVFEITLQITLAQRMDRLLQAADTAVVVVMDVSNTMNSSMDNETGVKRLDAAKEAACGFVDVFCGADMLGDGRQLGFVTFCRDAQTVFAPQRYAEGLETEWKNSIMSVTTGGENLQWTNIEAGLTLAHNLLAPVSAQYKFVILLTDGFPTTYVASGTDSDTLITGHDPKTGFWDQVKNVECVYGTSYSDTGARHARTAAQQLRADGIDLFSIGVGIGREVEYPENSGVYVPETIQYHIDRMGGESVVERGADTAGGDFEIGRADDPDSYRRWLGGTAENGGIGGGTHLNAASGLYGTWGAYADANDTAALTQAFSLLVQELEIISRQAVTDAWIASDPMGEDVAFMQFAQLEGNDASVQENTIRWDLKTSAYETITDDDQTAYRYTLRYFVRLCNERSNFAFQTPCATNGAAELRYKVDQDGRLSEEKSTAFPMPQVQGYEGTLSFAKEVEGSQETADALSFAFALTHDPACSVCEGTVEISPVTAHSSKGRVEWLRVPSGHEYLLTETPMEGFEPPQTYRVEVAYGETTLRDANGEKTETVVNRFRPVSVRLRAEKELNGMTPPAASRFAFLLKDEQGQLLQTVQNLSGQILFEPLQFDRPGEFVFYVQEKPGDDERMDYDPAIYEAVVTVTADERGRLQAKTVYRRAGTPGAAEKMLFRNWQLPPASGDGSRLLLWSTAAIASALGAAWMMYRRKSRS